jgi:organic radical activating enzyme
MSAKINIRISDHILYVEVNGIDDVEKYQVAFYFFRDDEVLEKRWYADNFSVSYVIPNQGNGVYRVTAFIKEKNSSTILETVSSDELLCSGGKVYPFYRIEEMEMTNCCNLSCKNCCTPTTHYPKGYIDDRTVLMTLSWTKKGQTLNYHRQGEPLLHKDLEKYIKWGVEAGIKPIVSTNGLLLTRQKLDSLFKSGLRYLVITLHTIKSIEAFKMAYAYFKEKGIEIVNFSQRHKKYDKEVMFFSGKILDFLEKDVVLQEMLESLGGYKEYLQLTDTHTWAGNVEGTKTDFPDELVSDRMKKCYFVNKHVVNVRWDGSVVGCCFDSENDNEIGHISEFANVKIDLSKYSLCKHCDANWAVEE